MKNEIVNAFHIIRPLVASETPNSMNRIFGPSPAVSPDRWPKVDNLFSHHIITFDSSGFHLPQNQEIAAISLFRSQTIDDFEKNTFQLVLTSREEFNTFVPNFPDSYVSSLKGRLKDSRHLEGQAFKLEVQKHIPDEFIKNGLSSEVDYFPIPKDYSDINEYDTSFIGGFPLWAQANATPRQRDGRPAHFLMQLMGYDEWFQESFMQGFDLYIFLTEEGEMLYEAQS